ncbi:MAG: type VI secretion system tube protein Hcp [Pseudomonadota bacterium]
MPVDAFLIFKEPGPGAVAIKGETRDEKMQKDGAFEIESFSFSIENTLNIGSASGGAGAGKAEFAEFSVTKSVDSGSPGLFKTCCTGGHYNDVRLHMRRAGGDHASTGKEFLIFKFKLVAVKSISWSEGDEVPKEDVVFEYGAIQINYARQKNDGTHEAFQQQHWSRVKNQNVFEV